MKNQKTLGEYIEEMTPDQISLFFQLLKAANGIEYPGILRNAPRKIVEKLRVI